MRCFERNGCPIVKKTLSASRKWFPRAPAEQIIDTGLDETSCFFADGDGEDVTHGHYFEELSEKFTTITSQEEYYGTVGFEEFEGGDFSFDLSRRKVGLPRERV